MRILYHGKKEKLDQLSKKVTIAVGLATLIQMIIDLIIKVLQYIK
ncbi:hypothetical protein [Granulicatella balaenopterae]|nr:hypothetical protein [Granulicatella balaenopterae]